MELTQSEQTRLAELEKVINDGLLTFIDVGAALLEIRNSRLYLHEYSTFEQYCREKWSMARRTAYQLMDAVAVVDNVCQGAQIPTTERQVRPLAKLEPEEQRTAWQRAIETAPEGKVTGAHVQKIVDAIKPKKPKKLKKKPEQEQQIKLPAYAKGVANFIISHLTRIKRDDPERIEALTLIMDWIKKELGNGKT